MKKFHFAIYGTIIMGMIVYPIHSLALPTLKQKGLRRVCTLEGQTLGDILEVSLPHRDQINFRVRIMTSVLNSTACWTTCLLSYMVATDYGLIGVTNHTCMAAQWSFPQTWNCQCKNLTDLVKLGLWPYSWFLKSQKYWPLPSTKIHWKQKRDLGKPLCLRFIICVSLLMFQIVERVPSSYVSNKGLIGFYHLSSHKSM